MAKKRAYHVARDALALGCRDGPLSGVLRRAKSRQQMHARKAVRLQRLLFARLDAGWSLRQREDTNVVRLGWRETGQQPWSGLVWSGRQRNRGGDKRGLQARAGLVYVDGTAAAFWCESEKVMDEGSG